MRLFFCTIALVLLTGAMDMVCYGAEGGDRYGRYVSKDAELGIAMDCPSGWSVTESRGALGQYAEVGFYEPKVQGKKLSSYITVTAIAFSKAEFEPRTLQGLADDLAKKRLLLSQAKLVSRTDVKFLETDAIALHVSYQSPEDFYKVPVNFVPVEEKIVIFAKGEKFYIVRYSNTVDDFKNLEPLFDMCAQSLKPEDGQ